MSPQEVHRAELLETVGRLSDWLISNMNDPVHVYGVGKLFIEWIEVWHTGGPDGGGWDCNDVNGKRVVSTEALESLRDFLGTAYIIVGDLSEWDSNTYLTSYEIDKLYGGKHV